MIAYIIKFVLCSGFLYSFYKVFLERESMYKINRFYLLLALIFAIIAPLYKMELPITENEMQLSPELIAYLMSNPQLLQKDTGFTWTDALDWIYSLVGIGLAIRFIINIMAIIYRIQQDEKYELEDLTIVLDQQSKQPFSFLHYIFLPKENYAEIHPNLIQHEKAHCIQKHSWDILFLEIYQIIFWFNPFVYLYKKSIQLNHEFLADEYVLQNDVDLKMYQHQILDCIATESQHSVASHFNFILTKKRLLMMTKNTSKRKIGFLSFASLPFILSAFVLFSQKTFAQEVEQKAKKVENSLNQTIEKTLYEKTKKTVKQRFEENSKDSIKNLDSYLIKNLDYSQTDIELKNQIKTENLTIIGNNISKQLNFPDELKSISPQDILSIIVDQKKEAFTIVKKNNDTIILNVNSSFIPSNNKQLSIDQIKTNELLTDNVKSKLKTIYPNDIKSYEIYQQDFHKIVRIDDKEYVLTDDAEILKELSTTEKEKIFKLKQLLDHKNLQRIKIKAETKEASKGEENPWKISVQPHSNDNNSELSPKSTN